MIKLQNITKSFEQAGGLFHALHTIDLHVKKGECVVLRGASGSGKSTLLSLIAGLQKPTSGYIEVDGKAIAKLPEAHSAQFRRETIGFIFQKYHLIPTLSVEENILLPLIPFNFSLAEAKGRVQAVMEQFSIAHKARLHVKLLSGGEQQMLAIARGLMARPKLLLLDEPSLGLAPLYIKKIFQTLRELNRDHGVTILLIEQNAHHALRVAHRGYVMQHGQIVMTGSGRDLLASAEVRAAYLEGGHAPEGE